MSQQFISEAQASTQQTSKWTEAEIEWLKSNNTQGFDYLIKHLGRSYTPIAQKLHKLRLSSKPNKQLKELPSNDKIYVKTEWCNLPTFHPVMLGIYPVSQENGSSSRWRKRRALILKMHDYCCAYCGDDANTVDHVIPMAKGGTDHPMNLVACCSRCNSAFRDKVKHIEFKICDTYHSHIVRQ